MRPRSPRIVGYWAITKGYLARKITTYPDCKGGSGARRGNVFPATAARKDFTRGRKSALRAQQPDGSSAAMMISLRYKAAILIALTEIALLGLLLLTNLYQTRRDLEEELTVLAASTAELVAASATEPPLSYDLAQLQKLLNGVGNKPRVRYVAVTDRRGRLLAEAGDQDGPEATVRAERSIAVAGGVFGQIRLEVSRAAAEGAGAETTRSNSMIAALEILLVALISLTLGWPPTRNLLTLARGAERLGRGRESGGEGKRG